MTPFRFDARISYAVAVLGVIAATAVRYSLDDLLADRVSFGFYFLAVALAAWIGGIGPAAVAAVLGGLAANFLFTEPEFSLIIDTAEELASTLIFISVSLILGILSEISRRSLARAKQLEQQKDDFLATLAHELRNPLTVIQYAIELDRIGGFENREERSDVIDRQVEHLSRMIEDLLDVSRAARGKIQLETEALDAAELVTAALEKAQPAIDRREHVLHVHVPPEPLPLVGDRLRLTQVLTNLLTNAAKYTPERGEIEFATYADRDNVVFSVRDNGVGIPKHMLHQVFGLFSQVEENSEKTDGGLGIGLALVQNLVKLHGGTVIAKSEGPNRGSEFSVRLPSPRQSRRKPTGAQSAEPVAGAR